MASHCCPQTLPLAATAIFKIIHATSRTKETNSPPLSNHANAGSARETEPHNSITMNRYSKLVLCGWTEITAYAQHFHQNSVVSPKLFAIHYLFIENSVLAHSQIARDPRKYEFNREKWKIINPVLCVASDAWVALYTGAIQNDSWVKVALQTNLSIFILRANMNWSERINASILHIFGKQIDFGIKNA